MREEKRGKGREEGGGRRMQVRWTPSARRQPVSKSTEDAPSDVGERVDLARWDEVGEGYSTDGRVACVERG